MSYQKSSIEKGASRTIGSNRLTEGLIAIADATIARSFPVRVPTATTRCDSIRGSMRHFS